MTSRVTPYELDLVRSIRDAATALLQAWTPADVHEARLALATAVGNYIGAVGISIQMSRASGDS